MSYLSLNSLRKSLRDIDNFLSQYHKSQHSIYFEGLISQTLAKVLNLPFFSSDKDDPLILRKVVWNGKLSPLSKAPSGRPDCIVTACGFNCIVEITLKTGSNQWTQEGAQLVNHTRDAIAQRGWSASDTYTIFIVKRLSRDTFFYVHGIPIEECKIVLLESDILLKILETSILAYSMRNLELRGLMEKLIECTERCSSLNSYADSVQRCTSDWLHDVLESEKDVYIGIKAYEAMKKIGRSNIGEGEIYRRLEKHPYVLYYLKKIDQQLGFDIIVNSLLRQGLAKCIRTYDERLLIPVPSEDFVHRGYRIIDKVRSMRG